MANSLYEITMKVLRDGGGAYVSCYAAGPDHEAAIRSGVTKLAGTGFHFDALVGPVREIDPSRWSDYVAKVWPECTATLPGDMEISAIVSEGGAFFGPFSTFPDDAGPSLA